MSGHAKPKVRAFVYERDGGMCQVCNKKIEFGNFDCGHIVDESRGGSSDLGNIVAMCKVCNLVKPEHKTREEYFEWVKSGKWNVDRTPDIDDQRIKQFWVKVDKSGDCWIWKGALNHDGYGYFYTWGRDKWQLSHRLSYFLAYGDLPAGLIVAHKCDNRACCNPDHLFLTDHAGNIKDACDKGRSASLTGYNCGNSKLTWREVCEIRMCSGCVSRSELSDIYGVAYETITAIWERKTWKTPTAGSNFKSIYTIDKSNKMTDEDRVLYLATNRTTEDTVSGCWVWSGMFDFRKYRWMYVIYKKKYINILKFYWTRRYGEFPVDIRFEAKCGNTMCVNPDHQEIKQHLRRRKGESRS